MPQDTLDNDNTGLYDRSWEDILQSCEDLDDIQTKADVKLRANWDFEFFLSKLMGLRVDNDLIQDGIETVENPPEQPRNKITKIARLAPRGHSKTYTWTVGQTLWRAFKEKGTQMLIVSSTEDQAKGILEEIKRFIKRNDALQHLEPATGMMNDVGDTEAVDIEEGEDKWAAQKIVTTTDCRITAQPFTSKIRSSHIDYVFCDDLLDDDESGKSNMEKDKKIYYNVITPAVESQGLWVQVIGTPQKHNDLIMELVDEKDGYDSERYQAYDEDTKEVLWEYDDETRTGWTYEQLMSKKEDIGPSNFAKEYMCVEKGTPVQLKNGWKSIEDVEVGDKVLTHEGNYKEVIKTFDNGEKDIYNIYTPGYSDSVGLTSNHPILTKDGWKDAGNISRDDFVLSPRMYGEKSLSESKAIVYGWYAAEGAIGANGRQVVFYVKEDESEELHNSLDELGYSPKYYGGNSEKMNPITVNSKNLASELENRFGRSKEKKVWSEMHEMDLETQENFLRAYLEGDGYEKREGIYSSRSVCLALSEGMARIATSLGWTVTRDYENPPFEETVNIGSRGGDVSCSDWHRVRYYENESKRAEVTDDYVAYPVDAAVKNGSAEVHNLEVEDDNSYHLPMFAVHNCNPMSVDDQYFSREELIEPNLDTEYDESHWKPNVQDEYYDDWQFVMGADLALSDAKDADFTVFTVLGIDPRGKIWLCDIWRNRGNSSETIADKLMEFDERYHFREGLIEKNSVGEGVWTTILDRCPSGLTNRVTDWDTTRKTRPKILSNLQAALERGDIVLHRHDALIKEMEGFEMNNKGKLEGREHDDCVMSLAIAYHQLVDEEFGNTEVSISMVGMDGKDQDGETFTETGDDSSDECPECESKLVELARKEKAICRNPRCEYEESLSDFRNKQEQAEEEAGPVGLI